jgi:hypothetical protein
MFLVVANSQDSSLSVDWAIAQNPKGRRRLTTVVPVDFLDDKAFKVKGREP